MFKTMPKQVQQSPEKKRLMEQTRGSDQYTAMRQMASLMGNQAMLGMMQSQGQYQKEQTPFFDDMRKKFGQKQKPESQASPTHQSSGGTSLPDYLREKFEKKSGLPMDDVRVHYNSDKPAELGAYAYTQGSDVYVAHGQEKYLEHELGHVVQQKQGIVRPTKFENGVPINDDFTMEKSANKIQKCAKKKTPSRVIQKGRITVKNKRVRTQAKKIAKGRGKLPYSKRNTTTFRYFSGRQSQGPHTIPVVMRTVFLNSLRNANFPVKTLRRSRILLSPDAAKANIDKVIAAGGRRRIRPRNLALYNKRYKKLYEEFENAKTDDKRYQFLGALFDMSPFQTYCVNRDPTPKEIGGKGESRRSATEELLGTSTGSTIDFGVSTNPGLDSILKQKVQKTLSQMQKIIDIDGDADFSISEDSEEK